jgi:sugar phosphate isomerase/epimerase
MHTQRQGGFKMAEAHALISPWTRHLHVHDGRDTLDRLELLPIGTGDFDHLAVLRLLKRSGYNGYISGEWIESIMSPEFIATHLGSEIRTLRKLEAQA